MTEPSLFMVELICADWRATLAWYTEILNLPLLLCDEAQGFALLRAGTGRVAIKAGTPRPGNTVLTFEVADLPTELERLATVGVTPNGSIKDSPEGYRRVVIHDPEGYRLALIDWGGRGTPGW